MNIHLKKAIILITLVSLVGFPFGASAISTGKSLQEEADGGVMVFDLCIVRPFSFAATLLGSVAFIVSLPFSVIGGNSETAYEKMVIVPAKYTFQRPLGKL